MNRRSVLALSPLVLAASSAPAWAAAGANAVATVEAFHIAMGQGDAAAVADFLLQDAVIYEQGGAESSKAEYVQAHLPGDIAFSQGMTDTVTDRRSSVQGGVSWVLSQGRTTGTFEGKKVDRLTTETMVLKKTKGAWRIAHIHWSSRAAPPS